MREWCLENHVICRLVLSRGGEQTLCKYCGQMYYSFVFAQASLASLVSTCQMKIVLGRKRGLADLFARGPWENNNLPPFMNEMNVGLHPSQEVSLTKTILRSNLALIMQSYLKETGECPLSLSEFRLLTRTQISRFCTIRATFFHLKCLSKASLDGFSIVSGVLVLKQRGNFSLFENKGEDVLYPI